MLGGILKPVELGERGHRSGEGSESPSTFWKNIVQKVQCGPDKSYVPHNLTPEKKPI
jgi:hypothetical protein